MLEWVAISFSRNLPDPGIELLSLASPALAGRFFATRGTWEARGDIRECLLKVSGGKLSPFS